MAEQEQREGFPSHETFCFTSTIDGPTIFIQSLDTIQFCARVVELCAEFVNSLEFCDLLFGILKTHMENLGIVAKPSSLSELQKQIYTNQTWRSVMPNNILWSHLGDNESGHYNQNEGRDVHVTLAYISHQQYNTILSTSVTLITLLHEAAGHGLTMYFLDLISESVPLGDTEEGRKLEQCISQHRTPPKKSWESNRIPSSEAGNILEEVLTGGYTITYGHLIGTAVTLVNTIYFEAIDERRRRYETHQLFWEESQKNMSQFLTFMHLERNFVSEVTNPAEYIMNHKCCIYVDPSEDPRAHRKVLSFVEEIAVAE